MCACGSGDNGVLAPGDAAGDIMHRGVGVAQWSELSTGDPSGAHTPLCGISIAKLIVAHTQAHP